MRAEVGRLEEPVGERTEGGAVHGVDVVQPVGRPVVPLPHDVLPDLWIHDALQLSQELVTYDWRGLVPVDARFEIGHRRQHVQEAVPWRGQAWIGDRRNVQMEGRLGRKRFGLKNGIQSGLIVLGEIQGLVLHVRVGPVHAQVQDVARAGIFHPVQSPVGIVFAVLARNELAVGVGQIGVGDDEVGVNLLARLQPDTSDTTIRNLDLGYGCVGADHHAHIFRQAHHVFDDAVDAAHGILHPQRQVGVGDEAVHGQCIERGESQEHRME